MHTKESMRWLMNERMILNEQVKLLKEKIDLLEMKVTNLEEKIAQLQLKNNALEHENNEGKLQHHNVRKNAEAVGKWKYSLWSFVSMICIVFTACLLAYVKTKHRCSVELILLIGLFCNLVIVYTCSLLYNKVLL